MLVVRKVQALIVVSLEPSMAKSVFTRLLVLLLLSIPNQPDALVEAESSLSCSSEEFACHDQSGCIPKSECAMVMVNVLMIHTTLLHIVMIVMVTTFSSVR